MTTPSNPNPILRWWNQFEKYPTTTGLIAIFGLIAVNFVAFIFNLGNTGLVDETEPLFAEAARQMTETGNWITPYFNTETRFDKPPLIYWLMAIAYKIIGVNEWAVRLPSALAAIALTVMVFLILLQFGYPSSQSASNPLDNPADNPQVHRQRWIAAWIGGAIAAMNLGTLIWARQGVSDMLLSGCMGTALIAFFWGYSQDNSSKQFKLFRPIPNRGYLAFYVLSALAVLTKGPVGLVLPGLIVLAFLAYLGKMREVLGEMGLGWGTILFLAITVPWFVLVIQANGDTYINSFFGYHNLERFTHVVNRHSAPWYFYFLIVLALFAPWSIYLPFSIVRLQFWQFRQWRRQPRHAHLGLFALLWFVVIFVFFTIAVTKLPSYVLPLMPAASILVALAWSSQFTTTFTSNQTKSKGLSVSIAIHLGLLLAMAIASWFLPGLIGTDPAMLNLSKVLDSSTLPLRSSIIWGLTLGVSSILFLQRKRWRWIIGVNILGFFAFLIFFVNPALILTDQVRQQPLREIAQTLTHTRQPNEAVMMIGFKKPSISFYSQYQPIGYFWTLDDPAKAFLAKIDQNTLSSPTLLLIGEPSQILETGLSPKDYQVISDRNPYQLVRVYRQTLDKQYDH